ncbi:MAG TPA: hypothetical protein HPP80_07195 [Rhodospirillaceae bacterium]|nr:hypothetical protein [Rhodospirillaceae bacterium]
MGGSKAFGIIKRFWLPLGALVGLALVLGACYLPDKFKSEIRLGRNGDFALSFYGELVWAPLFRDIQRGELSPSEAAAKIAGIQTDLERDSNFKSIESLGQGRFKVEYHREGHMQGSEQVTFVRRNAIILMLHAYPDGRVAIYGNTVKPSDAQTATNMGLSVEGEFRVVTDGLVKDHNATSVKPFGAYTVYIWKIENAFSPPPHFVMQREGVWPTKK